MSCKNFLANHQLDIHWWTEFPYRLCRANWTSGGMTFRLQPNRPARHDMLNNDTVILHHKALDD